MFFNASLNVNFIFNVQYIVIIIFFVFIFTIFLNVCIDALQYCI